MRLLRAIPDPSERFSTPLNRVSEMAQNLNISVGDEYPQFDGGERGMGRVRQVLAKEG